LPVNRTKCTLNFSTRNMYFMLTQSNTVAKAKGHCFSSVEYTTMQAVREDYMFRMSDSDEPPLANKPKLGKTLIMSTCSQDFKSDHSTRDKSVPL